MQTMSLSSSPRTRTYLWLETLGKSEEFRVWEVVDKVPPSTAPELECDRTPRDDDPSHKTPSRQGNLPGLVVEVSADGTEVVSWPGPETST